MSAHTPAPWHHAPAPDESGIDISGGGSVIATAWSGLDPDDAVMKANARLICASPDLLGAARQMVAALDATKYDVFIGSPSDLLRLTEGQRALVDAVSKAEGVQ